MGTNVLVAGFIEVLLADQEVGPDDLERQLERDGTPPDVAKALISFVPMAFAHALLAPIGVSLPIGLGYGTLTHMRLAPACSKTGRCSATDLR